MATYTPGSFVDNGRALSEGLEEITTNLNYEKAPGSSSSPLIFPQNIGSPGGYNNHFMIIDVLKDMSYWGLLQRYEDSNVPLARGRDYRTILQADATIIVYMPNTLQFTTVNDYEEISLTSFGLDNTIGSFGGWRDVGEKALELGGKTLNPRTEVLFSGAKLRQFQFDFLFAPSSEQETRTLSQILSTLRMAAAPTKDSNAISILWTAPRKLQIRYYQTINGVTKESAAIPIMKPVAIESLDIDYAPEGPYSTFSNGYPVATRMQLRVKEDEIIDRDFIKNEKPWFPTIRGPGHN